MQSATGAWGLGRNLPKVETSPCPYLSRLGMDYSAVKPYPRVVEVKEVVGTGPMLVKR